MGMITRSCLECGQDLPIHKHIHTNLTCQVCGSSHGFLSGEGNYLFKCVICNDLIEFEAGKSLDLFHDVPNCKNRILIFLGVSKEQIKKEVTTKNRPDLILFIRNRGLGDILMTTPVIRKLKQKYPDMTLWYCCDGDVAEVLEQNPNIDRIVNNRIFTHDLKPGLTIDLREKVENYSEEGSVNKQDRVERFHQLSGIYKPDDQDYGLDYFVTKEEIAWASSKLHPSKKNIGICVQSFAPYRSWPIKKYRLFINSLDREKYNIVILGSASIKMLEYGVINTAGWTTVREFAALISQCDVVLSGDSSAYHFAEALKVPSVVLFGSIPPESRISHYKYVVPLFEKKATECIPCWDHQFHTGSTIRQCHEHGAMCMKAITIEMVQSTIMDILQKPIKKKKIWPK